MKLKPGGEGLLNALAITLVAITIFLVFYTLTVVLKTKNVKHEKFNSEIRVHARIF